MKKVLSLVLSVLMLCTMLVPVSADDIEIRDFLDYLYDNDVNPYTYAVVCEYFVNPDSYENGIFTLKSREELEEIVEAIVLSLEIDGVMEDDISVYAEQFYSFFENKSDLFSVFSGFVMQDNIMLPFADQPIIESNTPGITGLIRDNFYCETFFLNLLSKINETYMAAKNDKVLRYYDNRLVLKDDAADYIDFLAGDGVVKQMATSAVIEMLDIINESNEAEKAFFCEFLISIGMLSTNMDDTSVEETPEVDTTYDDLKAQYAGGTDKTNPFYSIDEILEEYIPLINAASGQNAKSDVIHQAMSKAATIRYKGDVTLSGNKNDISINSVDILNFACLSAQKLRNEIIKNNISVSMVQGYDVVIEIEDNEQSKGFKFRVLNSALDTISSQYAREIKVKSKDNGLGINAGATYDSELISGNYFEISMLCGKGAEIAPEITGYADAEIIKISAGSFDGNIPYDTVYFEKNIANNADEYEVNNMYAIGTDGSKVKVSDYSADGEKITFEIGSGRYFTKITAADTPSTDDNNNNNDNDRPSTPGYTEPDDPTPDNPTPDDTEKEEKPDAPVVISPKPPVTSEVKFSDVPDSHWAKSYIEELAGKGILNGVGNNMFAPDVNVTREQFAKIIAEAFGIVNENAKCDFADVESGSWYAVYVASVYEKGIVNGMGDGSFGTGRSISRQDMATMIVRAAKACSVNLGTVSSHAYNDSHNIADYAKEAVALLVGADVVSGFEDNTFRPTQNSTRAQVAKIVSSVLNLK